ncbi:MAG: preprotein translocase subunit SecE, partial [Sulfuricellaceae bacterium]|nr:preprotein translocase subunit SecE [Sulfuricellaceae bacterium]
TETKKVVWPTRKETTQTTAVVFALVVLMAIFMWVVDAGLAWSVKQMMGWGS